MLLLYKQIRKEKRKLTKHGSQMNGEKDKIHHIELALPERLSLARHFAGLVTGFFFFLFPRGKKNSQKDNRC